MKDLGKAKMILGIKITRTPNGLKLSQEHYVEKILRKFEHLDCKTVSTPYDPSSQLKKNKEHSVAQIEFAQIIGSLMYLMNCTRPDIAYVVRRLSQYTQSPNQDHRIVQVDGENKIEGNVDGHHSDDVTSDALLLLSNVSDLDPKKGSSDMSNVSSWTDDDFFRVSAQAQSHPVDESYGGNPNCLSDVLLLVSNASDLAPEKGSSDNFVNEVLQI